MGDFVKKYIEVAKCLKPVLTEEACEMIGEEYSRLRSQDFESGADNNARTQPVTARALETLIRLATAHAKARLSKNIEKEDADSEDDDDDDNENNENSESTSRPETQDTEMD